MTLGNFAEGFSLANYPQNTRHKDAVRTKTYMGGKNARRKERKGLSK
jgi:hypothetical protein